MQEFGEMVIVEMASGLCSALTINLRPSKPLCGGPGHLKFTVLNKHTTLGKTRKSKVQSCLKLQICRKLQI